MHQNSGGPLFVENTSEANFYSQIGIVSSGVECGAYDHPSVFTDIMYYYGWIQRKLCSGDIALSSNSTLCQDTLRDLNPSATSSDWDVPGLSTVCSNEIARFFDDPNVSDAAGLVEEGAVISCNEDGCTREYFSEDTDVLLDVCEDNGGIAYSYILQFQCSSFGQEQLLTYRNFMWCVGKECTFEETENYIENILIKQLGNDGEGVCKVAENIDYTEFHDDDIYSIEATSHVRSLSLWDHLYITFSVGILLQLILSQD